MNEANALTLLVECPHCAPSSVIRLQGPIGFPHALRGKHKAGGQGFFRGSCGVCRWRVVRVVSEREAQDFLKRRLK